MAISFDKAFGSHAHAMQLRAKRSEVLANNIANADTPGYKARDLDFKQMLQANMGNPGENLQMSATSSGHSTQLLSPDSINGLMYRHPSQPAIDDNTVDVQVERAEFARNTLQYQAAFTFLNSKVNGLKSAIRGE